MRHPIMIIILAVEPILSMSLTLWMYLTKCAIITFVIVAFIPNISLFVFIENIWNVIIIPFGAMFNYFSASADYFRAASSVNGLHAFANLFAMLGCVVLMLGIPLLFAFLQVLVIGAALFSMLMPSELIERNIAAEKNGGKEPQMFDRNDYYILTGRTTVDDVFKAEVEATAIAEALKR